MQIVPSSRRGSRDIEHLGSAHGPAEEEALREMGRQRIAAGQVELELALGEAAPTDGGPLRIVSSRRGSRETLCRAYDTLGLDQATAGDAVSGNWCWPESSSPPASRTPSGWSRVRGPCGVMLG